MDSGGWPEDDAIISLMGYKDAVIGFTKNLPDYPFPPKGDLRPSTPRLADSLIALGGILGQGTSPSASLGAKGEGHEKAGDLRLCNR